MLKKILYFVTDSENIEPNSRGGNIDARDLHVIETFMGREFTGVGGKNPNSNAAKILNDMYSTIENTYFNDLNADSIYGAYINTVFVRLFKSLLFIPPVGKIAWCPLTLALLIHLFTFTESGLPNI